MSDAGYVSYESESDVEDDEELETHPVVAYALGELSIDHEIVRLSENQLPSRVLSNAPVASHHHQLRHNLCRSTLCSLIQNCP